MWRMERNFLMWARRGARSVSSNMRCIEELPMKYYIPSHVMFANCA
jgi:hypothetical protein